MAHIQLNHVQNYIGQEIMNRYFYFTAATVTIGHLDDLAEAFEDVIVPLVNALQITSCTNSRIDTREIGGVLFSTRPLTGGGSAGGEESPSWNALSFLLQRSDASTKSGGKRIGGLSESNLRGNEIFPDPTYEGLIQDYADTVPNVLNGGLANYVPELIRFDPANPGTILASQNFVSASYRGLSTQNTRKP